MKVWDRTVIHYKKIRFENTQWRKVKGWAKGKCRIGQRAIIKILGLKTHSGEKSKVGPKESVG